MRARDRLAGPRGDRLLALDATPGRPECSSLSPASTTSTTRSPPPPLCLGLGVALPEIVAGLERFRAAFGRFERFAAGDRSVLLLLIKNPAGANEVVRTLDEAGVPPTIVVALNDRIADGRDVSWIWDVDFEPLLARVERVVVAGERAAELGLRFPTAACRESGSRSSPTSRRRSTAGSR